MSINHATSKIKSKRKLLIVEDNPGDVRLTIEALKDINTDLDLKIITDSELVMDLLTLPNEKNEIYKPDLILLDLNIPKKSGIELLQEIKGDKLLKRIPVVALTTSEADHDVNRAYDLHANAYLVKPVDFNDFLKMLAAVNDFWLGVNKNSP